MGETSLSPNLSPVTLSPMTHLLQVAKTLRAAAALLEGSTQKRLDYVLPRFPNEDAKFFLLHIIFTAVGIDRWNKKPADELMEEFADHLSRSSIVDPYIPWLANHIVKNPASVGLDRNGLADATKFHAIKLSFRAIAIWASETRTDIGKVSVEEALEKAQAYVPRAAKKGTQESEANPTVYEFADGHKVVQLKTDEALKHEGDVLKHCVGTYCEAVKAGDLIFSLRTKEGKSLITIHAEKTEDGYRFTQMLGENNREATKEEQKLLIEFIESKYPKNPEALLLAGKPARSIDFKGANLARANFYGFDLYGVNFTRTVLARAILEDTMLEEAILDGSILTRADLTGAVLDRAKLRKANLTGAYLHGAKFRGADLTGANLTEAYLEGANFTGATLEGADLTNIRYNDHTKWPEDFAPPPSA